MIWLLPAAGCSILVALILKINEVRGGSRILLVGSNYIVASLLSLILLGGRISRPDAITLTIGSVMGIDFVLGFLLLMAGIARGPLAIPVTVMRLSVRGTTPPVQLVACAQSAGAFSVAVASTKLIFVGVTKWSSKLVAFLTTRNPTAGFTSFRFDELTVFGATVTDAAVRNVSGAIPG